jgi:hypothetical protein
LARRGQAELRPAPLAGGVARLVVEGHDSWAVETVGLYRFSHGLPGYQGIEQMFECLTPAHPPR